MGTRYATAPRKHSAPRRDFEYVEGWGMTVGAHARVLKPRSTEELVRAYELAREEGLSLGLRGSGCSYGDASVNAPGHTLDLSLMNRILSFDEETGVIETEGGATVADVWQHSLPRGFWPKVVSGTMFPTLGGALGMNIHGKNNYKVGTIGDNTLEIDLVLPSGEVRTCDREQNSDLFHAAIGGFGMLGTISRVRLQTKRVYSGDLWVRGISTHDLAEMLAVIEERRGEADYLVGWLDCFTGGDRLGRGLIHEGRYYAPEEDPDPAETLALSHQVLPERIMGLFPKSQVWRVLRLFNNDLGMRAVNAAKMLAGRAEGMQGWYTQSHAAFNFLLDFVPDWKWAYGRKPGHGLIQYQSFVPTGAAHDVFSEILEQGRRRGIVSYLGVLKRHRPDPFWLTHGLDGWSLALDYKITPRNREAVFAFCREMSELVIGAGGKHYFAKDLCLREGDAARFLPPERLEAFRALKREHDPDDLFATDLARRIFGERLSGQE